jgi:hypothetical protein
MKIINDPFWKSLMGDEVNAWDDGDDKQVACSITQDNDALDGGGDQPMADIGDDMDGDEEVGHKGGGDEEVRLDGDGDEDVGHDGDGDEDVECDDEVSELVAHTVPSNADQLLYDEEDDT